MVGVGSLEQFNLGGNFRIHTENDALTCARPHCLGRVLRTRYTTFSISARWIIQVQRKRISVRKP